MQMRNLSASNAKCDQVAQSRVVSVDGLHCTKYSSKHEDTAVDIKAVRANFKVIDGVTCPQVDLSFAPFECSLQGRDLQRQWRSDSDSALAKLSFNAL